LVELLVRDKFTFSNGKGKEKKLQSIECIATGRGYGVICNYFVGIFGGEYLVWLILNIL